MKEPYRTIWYQLVVAGHIASGGEKYYGVRWSKSEDAFYIGKDESAEHITILKGTNGFHHTVTGSTGSQHTSSDTLSKIVNHIDHNPSHYGDASIRTAVAYMAGR